MHRACISGLRGSVFSGIGVGLGCQGFAAHETEPSLTELGMSIFSLLTVQQHFSVVQYGVQQPMQYVVKTVH